MAAKFAEALARLRALRLGQNEQPERGAPSQQIGIETGALQPVSKELADLLRRIVKTRYALLCISFHLFTGRQPDRAGDQPLWFRCAHEITARQVALGRGIAAV